MVGEEFLYLVDRGILGADRGRRAGLLGALLEDVADVFRLDLHADEPFRLVDGDALCVAFFYVLLERRVVRLLVDAARLVALPEGKEKADEHKNVDPSQAELGKVIFRLVFVHMDVVRNLRGLFDVGHGSDFGVFPKVLEVIIVAHVGQEDVDKIRAVVHGHPLGIGASDNGGRLFVGLCAGRFFHGARDGFDLLRRVALADDEMLAGSRRNGCQVSNDDVAAFFFLDTFYDGLD